MRRLDYGAWWAVMNGAEEEADMENTQQRCVYYPPISDNRYRGLIYWWTFAELRADPDQIERCVDSW